MHLALAAYMWGRLKSVFFLVFLKLYAYYSFYVEITQKNSQFAVLGLPSRLISQFSPKYKKTALSGADPRSILGAEQPKKYRPGTSGRLFWGVEGAGAEVKSTQKKDGSSSRSPALRQRR